MATYAYDDSDFEPINDDERWLGLGEYESLQGSCAAHICALFDAREIVSGNPTTALLEMVDKLANSCGIEVMWTGYIDRLPEPVDMAPKLAKLSRAWDIHDASWAGSLFVVKLALAGVYCEAFWRESREMGALLGQVSGDVDILWNGQTDDRYLSRTSNRLSNPKSASCPTSDPLTG